MTHYDRLDHADRAWSVCEAARFLGYNPKYVYQLIRENKIEGWFEVNGSYRFCPAKLKAWLEKRIGTNGGKDKKPDEANGEPKNDSDEKPKPEEDNNDKVA